MKRERLDEFNWEQINNEDPEFLDYFAENAVDADSVIDLTREE